MHYILVRREYITIYDDLYAKHRYKARNSFICLI
jgi:hypothetical protein